MIETDNGVYYMTAGETCYVIAANGGTLGNVYFGKRVEREDDISTLGGDRTVFPEFALTYTRGGKSARTEFAPVGAEILEEKPLFDAPTLCGGKTLAVTVQDKAAGLRAELYYTPYPRGGFSRRAVVYNESKKTVTIGCASVFSAFGTYDVLTVEKSGAVERKTCGGVYNGDGLSNFTALLEHNADDERGSAYGFVFPYGDGALRASVDKQSAYAEACLGDGIVVAAGASVRLPETLAVYSDRGACGMTRVFHDILRENMGDKTISERRPTVLFCPALEKKQLLAAVSLAAEIGFDVFATDGGAVSADTLSAVAEECKQSGIRAGLSVLPSAIARSSAVYCDACVPDKTGKSSGIDLSRSDAVQVFSDALCSTIAKNGISYLMIDLPRGGSYPFAAGMYALRKILADSFPDLVTEWGAVPPEMRYAQSLCYPPCVMRNTVDATANCSFKTRFDCATFGCLGYALDPNALSDDAKRAVRAQILSYQDDASAVIRGDLYRPKAAKGDRCRMAVTKDKSKAYAVYERNGSDYVRIKLVGLDERNIYHIRELGKTFSGAALVNYGVAVPSRADGDTFVLHLRQVADYE